MSSDFVSWVRSPERTQEELITVERITEMALPLWRQRHGLRVQDFSNSYAVEKERRNQRCNNPAYLPVLVDTALVRTEEMLPEFTEIKLPHGGEDRIVRAISPLRWLPRLERLFIGTSELEDPQVLRELTGLRVLHIFDKLLDDGAHVGACTGLRELNLSLWRPWPVLGALSALTGLEHFSFSGNAFALEDVPALPAVRSVAITGRGHAPRDLQRLPEFPLVEVLSVNPVFGLKGIERYPRVRNLTLGGPMEDLRPLAALRALTFAELQGNEFRDVSPLASLPELRWLRFRTSRPRDYSALAETPRLHEVEVFGCDIHAMELGALHAALEPWDAEWSLPEPRPLKKEYGFFHFSDFGGGDRLAPHWPLPDPEGATWNGDGRMEFAERRWFQQLVDAEVRRFFGLEKDPGKRFRRTEHGNREARVRLEEFEHIERFPGLLDALRPLLARTRFRHAIWVEAAITVKEARGGDSEWQGGEDTRDDRAWMDEHQRKQREQAEREHRFELRKSEGVPLDPEEFAAPPLDEDKVLVPAGTEGEQPAVPWTRPEVDPDEEPFDPDAWRFKPDITDWDYAVHFYGLLTAEAFLVADYVAAQAQYYLRRKAVKLRTPGN
jgi:hypothetical protein